MARVRLPGGLPMIQAGHARVRVRFRGEIPYYWKRAPPPRNVDFTIGRKYRRASGRPLRGFYNTQLAFENSCLECPRGGTVYTIPRPCLPRRNGKGTARWASSRASSAATAAAPVRSRAHLFFSHRTTTLLQMHHRLSWDTLEIRSHYEVFYIERVSLPS